uniref:Uncharacterized protein n=1 Tax=Spongospora subterranea TaxID=70186 RepID=A0A0H5QSE9_9EUKA|eukprot:CRZ04953.1 hypothetical protein [Spongospora subterranea]
MEGDLRGEGEVEAPGNDVEVGRSEDAVANTALDSSILDDDRLNSEQRESFRSSGGIKSLACQMDPPLMIDGSSGAMRISVAYILSNVRSESHSNSATSSKVCPCYACSAIKGSAIAARQLGLLNETGFLLNEPDLKQAAEWYGLAVLGDYNPAWSDLLRILQLLHADEKFNKEHFLQFEPLFRRAAGSGKVSEKFSLAEFLLNTKVQEKMDEARSLVRQCAEQGFASAEFQMGLTANEPNEAFLWFKRAADHGHVPAVTEVAVLLETGRGVKRSREQALVWFERAVEDRDPSAMLHLGNIILSDNRKRAIELFNAAIQLGNEDIRRQAQFALGCDQFETDTDIALDLLRSAAKSGLQEAQAKLAMHFYHSSQEQPVDGNLTELQQWFELAVEDPDCDPVVLLSFAQWLLTSNMDEQLKALSFIIRAAQLGQPTAQVLAYRMTISEDPVRAISWLKQAATLGYAQAQTELGKAFEEGVIDGSVNEQKAFHWYRKASAQADVEAQYRLYLLLKQGKHADLSEIATVTSWLKLAADHGYSPAQLELGNLLLRLTNVEKASLNLKDLDGLVYLDQAAENGIIDAKAAAAMHRLKNFASVHDFEAAYKQIDRCAHAGHLESRYFLASYNLQPQVRRLDDAMKYLSLGVENSDPRAQYMMAALLTDEHLFTHSIHPIVSSGDQAMAFHGVYLANQAAIHGVPEAQFLYGRLLQKGLAEDSNCETPVRYFKLAAASGCVPAALEVAKNVVGEELDFWLDCAAKLKSPHGVYLQSLRANSAVKSNALLQRAADLGHQAALFELGLRKDSIGEQEALIRNAANLGVPKAQRWMAHNALQENNDSKTWSEWLERAADGGDLESQRELATCKMHPRREIWLRRIGNRDGHRCCPSFLESVAMSTLTLPELNAQAIAGDASAQFSLALCSFDTPSTSTTWQQDFKEGKKWLKRSVRGGNTYAMVSLALVYEAGLGNQSRVCLPRAKSLLIEAADCGHADAFYLLASRYTDDNDEAKKYLQRAARLGHQLAAIELASRSHAAKLPIEEKLRLQLSQFAFSNPVAAQWLTIVSDPSDVLIERVLRQSASRGHPRAQSLFGERILHGQSVCPANPNLARQWFEKAAANNDIHGQFLSATECALAGEGDLARSFYEAAAFQGHRKSMEWVFAQRPLSVSSKVRTTIAAISELGDRPWALILSSKIAEKPEKDRLLKQAATLGDSQGQYLFGKALLLDREYESGVSWITKAAQQGNALACVDLALCFCVGQGTPVDWISARHYLTVAASLGNRRALSLLVTLHSISAFQSPQTSNLSLSYSLAWAKVAAPGHATRSCLNLQSSVNALVRDQVKSAETAFLKQRRLEIFACLRTLLNKKSQVSRKKDLNVYSVILEMVGNVNVPCDIDNSKSIDDRKRLMMQRHPAIYTDPQRLVSAGIQYLFADCVMPNVCLAVRFLQIAAGRGSPVAQTLVGHLYQVGGLGVSDEPWPAWATYWYAKAAANGEPTACMALAEIYEERLCWMSAALSLRKADELHHPEASSKLAVLFEVHPDMVGRINDVIRIARNERSFAFLSGIYSLQDQPSTISILKCDKSGKSKDTTAITRTILEMLGSSHLAWFPDPKVDVLEFLRSQLVEEDDYHVSSGDNILNQDGSDIRLAWRHYVMAAETGNIPAVILVANAIESGWISVGTSTALLWYQKASMQGSSLATQWIGSSLISGSSQNAIAAYSTLRRAEQLINRQYSRLPLQLSAGALAEAVQRAFPCVTQTASPPDSMEKQQRCLSLLLGLLWRTGHGSPLYQAVVGSRNLGRLKSQRSQSLSIPHILNLKQLLATNSKFQTFSKVQKSQSNLHSLCCEGPNPLTEVSAIHRVMAIIFAMSGDCTSPSRTKGWKS